MKTKPKKKTVTAWAAWLCMDGKECVYVNKSRQRVSDQLFVRKSQGHACGPIVKIALPLPKESKR